MRPVRSTALALGTALLFSTAVIAAELERVVIDSASPYMTTYVALPKGMPEGEIQRIDAKLQELKSAYIVDWSSFVANLEKHVNGKILKNEYPEYRIADDLVALLQKMPLTPFSLTWNGGVAITYNDHRHAQATYQRYLKDPTVATRPSDRRNDPVHPGNWIERLRREAEVAAKKDAEAKAQAETETRRKAEEQAKAAAAKKADEAPRTAQKPGTVFQDCADCPRMVEIPAGEFTMGSPASESGRFDSEGPQRTVRFAQPFAIGRTEVTQGEWRAVMGTNPSHFSNCGDDCSVEQVSWDDAREFARRLSERTGKHYRLPSEAEWEYACRAGGADAYCGGSEAGSVAWYDGNSANRTQRVGQKRPNAFGLYDMSGNVWEWTQDCWNANYGGAPTNGTAWLTGYCSQRVFRGGSWVSLSQLLRSAYRSRSTTVYRYSHGGFRLARTLE